MLEGSTKLLLKKKQKRNIRPFYSESMMTDDEQYGEFTKEHKLTENCENLAHAQNSVYRALLFDST